MTDTVSIVVAIAVFLALVGGWEMLTRRRKRRTCSRPAGSSFNATPKITPFPSATQQLETVMKATFEARRLMSQKESSVFYAAERVMKRLDIKGHVMAQVCLGEILRTPEEAAFRAVNSKRVDILLISGGGFPLAAIEYQGEGHYQGNAYARDAVKKAALQSAGIAYIEITPQHSANDIEREIARAMEAKAARAVRPRASPTTRSAPVMAAR